MKTAYLFPGQGVQSPGIGRTLYKNSPNARRLFETANEILGFRITDVMFEGTAEALQQTQVAQPAIFLYSIILARSSSHFQPNMVAGHSLGELSALVASQVLTFEDGLQLVAQRAAAMQVACELVPSTMAAVLGLSDEKVTDVCTSIEELVVPANYNCPGQLVISGTKRGIALACEALQAAGAKKIIFLSVSGAFHSPLMEPAKTKLAQAIAQTKFHHGICPIYQNVNATAVTTPALMQANLIEQLTSPVKWTQTIQAMVQDGAQHFIACGPGNVLQGLVKNINSNVQVSAIYE